LGLPAAVLAHSLSFGSGHTLGGSAHLLVFEATLAAACASMSALLFATIYFAAGRRNGSIVATRMAAYLPGAAGIALAAGGWFGLIERAEPGHGLSLIVAGAAILLSAFVLRSALASLVRFVAALTVAICPPQFANRAAFVRLQPVRVSGTTLCPVVTTRLSRPPPHFS